ncbi:MAG: hypothetical protein COS89_02940 [Deltaproteobacteria bacterium CG07_land_8_20_14_0_80_38_7]|nr:MAG: hypothetical protein COS89_02940 [Deltaproteobacteria bacterium CG07_land_8_20_14_0_80_38_7]
MNIIDAHVNITHDGTWGNAGKNASLTQLISEMEKASADKALLISLPGATTNKYIASVIKKHPDKFQGVGHLDFSREDLTKQVDELISMGFSGIKVHPRFQGINLNHPHFDHLWVHLDSKKTILLVDGYYQLNNSYMPIQHLFPLAYERNLLKHKNVTFILAHAGFHKVMDALFLCANFPNFYCDISYSINLIENLSCYNDYRYLIDQCDQKVLFGSDFPEYSISTSKKAFLKLAKGLDNSKIENILKLNAQKLFWK